MGKCSAAAQKAALITATTHCFLGLSRNVPLATQCVWGLIARILLHGSGQAHETGSDNGLELMPLMAIP